MQGERWFYQRGFGHLDKQGEQIPFRVERREADQKQSRRRKINHPKGWGAVGCWGTGCCVTSQISAVPQQSSWAMWRRAQTETHLEGTLLKSVRHKHKIHTSKQLHEKNRFDSVIAIPQSQQPSVHKAVPISSCLLKHTEDVKTVSQLVQGFRNGKWLEKQKHFYLVFAIFYLLTYA